MDKNTFRGLIAGMLIMGLFFTGVPVSADTTDTFSNRLVAAVNALKGSADTNAIKIGGVATAINNQSSALSAAIGNISSGGSSDGGTGNIKAKYMGNSSCSSGPGFAIVTPDISRCSGSGYHSIYACSISFTADGNNGNQSLGGLDMVSSANASSSFCIYPLTIYFQSSFSVSNTTNCTCAIYKYI